MLIAGLGALAATAMVASVVPFLTVLSDPQSIERSPRLSWAYHRFGFQSAHGFLIALGLGTVLVVMISALFQILKIYAVARFSLMRTYSLSLRLMSQYLGQPYEFFLASHSGDMGTRVLAECEQFVNRFLKPAMDLTTSLVLIASLLVFLLWVNPLVTVLAFGVIGGSYGLIYVLSRRAIHRLGVVRSTANAGRFRMAGEALGGVKDIKLLGREASYLARFRTPSLRWARAQMNIQLLSQLPKIGVQAVAIGGVVLICLFLVDTEAFDEGGAVAGILPLLGVFAFAAQRLIPEIGSIYSSIAMMQSGRAAVDLLHADLVERPAGRLRRGMEAPMGLRHDLLLERLSYRYPNADRAGVSDISLALRAGERVGVVGGSGAGKTTLADLLLGLLRPRSGRILVDGAEVTEDSLASWQRTVGYVPQEIFLTDASVAENIALGVPPEAIDMEKVRRAARIASLESFVERELPNGFDTAVGERGVRLSGGQRQRIGIARALYHDADLIVFDEATSALDNLTEREVMQAINALPGDKTIVMIAHRLSTVRACDRIVVLSEGRVAAVGTWEELMVTSPEFRDIARLADVA